MKAMLTQVNNIGIQRAEAGGLPEFGVKLVSKVRFCLKKIKYLNE